MILDPCIHATSDVHGHAYRWTRDHRARVRAHVYIHARARARMCERVVCLSVEFPDPQLCVRECCVNQPCDDDDGRSTVSTVPLPLAHVVTRSFLARRIDTRRSLLREKARETREGRRDLPLPFPTKIANESSLSLSRSFSRSLSRDGVLWPRFARHYFTLSSRETERGRGSNIAKGERETTFDRERFASPVSISRERRNGWILRHRRRDHDVGQALL